MNLNGKAALVTGAAAGIGAGIAERLAAEGMAVVIADPDEATGRATAARIGGSFVAADVATEAGVRAAIEARDRSRCWSTTPEASRSRASRRPVHPSGDARST